MWVCTKCAWVCVSVDWGSPDILVLCPPPPPRSPQKCRINLLDTVIVEGDSIAQWYFTSKAGKVMRKSEKNLSRDRVKSHFLRFSAAYPRNVNNYAAVFHYKESSKVFTADELNTALLSPLDTVLAMQPYAHPRGGTSGYSNFRHEYSIYGGNKDVVPVNNTFKYCESLPGDGPQLVRSKDSRVNAALEEMAVAVVKFVEATRRVHVTKMTAEFCVDTDNVPWFMRTTTFLTVKRAKLAASRRRGPAAAAANKTGPAGADGASSALSPSAMNLPANFPANRRPVSPLRDALEPGETYPRHLVKRKSPKKGRWPRGRRARRERVSSFAGSVASGVGGSSVASGDTAATPLGATGRIPDNVLEGLVDGDAPHVAYKSGTAEETLGSTQRAGCCGDFCAVKLAPKLTAMPGQGGGGGGGGGGGRPTWTAAAARAQVAGRMSEDDPRDVSRVLEDNGETYQIPYRMVAQARQEAYYVALMLKRHKQGQRGEFISSDYYPEHTDRIAQKFPASFYRQVEVCQRCFQVYQKVEVERNRSLHRRAQAERRAARSGKRSRRHGGGGGGGSSSHSRLPPSTPGLAASLHRSATAGSLSGGGGGGGGGGFAATAPGLGGHHHGHGHGGDGLPRAVSAGSLDGRGQHPRRQTPQEAAMARANAALGGLTLSDIAEVRSFVSPPPAVALVATALMLLLTGVPLEWVECRRLMARGDRLLDMILDLDPDRIPARRLRQLLPIIRNPVFHPDSVQLVCRAAACLAGWVLGVAEYAALAHNMSLANDGDGDGGDKGKGNKKNKKKNKKRRGVQQGSTDMLSTSSSTPVLPPLSAGGGSVSDGGGGGGGSGSSYSARMTFAQKLDRKRRQQQRRHARERAAATPSSVDSRDDWSGSATPWGSDTATGKFGGDGGGGGGGGKKKGKGKGKGKRRGGRGGGTGKKQGKSGGGGGGGGGGGVGKREAWGLSGTGGSRGMDATTGRPAKGRNAAAAAAARRAQAYHTKRLHEVNTVDPTGPQSFADAPVEAGEPDIESRPKMFRCADGVTTVPYQIIGAPDRAAGTVNFVVLQDFFDTFEGMQVLLRDFMKTTRSQFLLLNLPGQAFTDYDKADKQLVLNNEFHAAKVNELLANADRTLEFNTSSQGFHMVGIGNGGNVAACWAARFGNDRIPMLKSVVLVNGFAHVDKQLASILHSSANVFSCFPASRPDLPVSYFTRFLFSEDYVKRVSMDLALSMYTAVTNPITLDGRLRITRGALHHTDLRKLLPGVGVPLVIMQCTEDVLVSPSNVDALIEGRMARHVWSHEQDTGASASWFGPRSIQRLREVLRKPDAALVLWIKTGHEVRMEAKNQFLKLLESLSDPDAALSQAEAIAAGKSMPGVVAPTRIPAPPKFGVPDFHHQQQQPGGGEREGEGAGAGAGAGARAGAERVPVKYARRRRAAAAKKSSGRPTRSRRRSGSGGNGGDGDDSDAGGGGGGEASRKARLEETEASYQAAMREHKQRQAAEKQQQEEKKKAAAAAAAAAATAASSTGGGSRQAPPSPIRVSTAKAQHAGRAPPSASPSASPAPTSPAQAQPAQPESEPPSPRTAARQILDAGGMGPVHVTTGGGDASSVLPAQGGGSGSGSGTAASTRARREKEEEELAMRLAMLKAEQEARRRQWAEEDAAREAAVAAATASRARERDDEAAALQAEIEAQTRDMLVNSTRAATQAAAETAMKEQEEEEEEEEAKKMGTRKKKPAATADELAAVEGEQPSQQFTDLTAMFHEMEEEDRAVQAEHSAQLAQYQRVKTQMEEAKQAMLDQQMASRSAAQRRREAEAVVHLQRVGRGYLGRQRFTRHKENQEERMYKDMVATKINAAGRGFLGRRAVKRKKALVLLEQQKGGAAKQIQRVFRGHRGRERVRGMREDRASRELQRAYRGHLGRRYAHLRRAQRERAERERAAATVIQATWRMKMQFEEYRELQILQLAAIQLQRVWRGWLGRRRAKRKREWEQAAPGPERLKLGLTLIEGSKEAFERQRQEIDALHRAQERAEARVSEIYAGLKENEEELSTLERELSAVDQLDTDLRELTHDKRLLDAQVAKDEAQEAQAVVSRSSGGGGGGGGGRRGGGRRRSSAAEALAAQRAADAYALEVAIHMKKAEREKKKLELEAEFAGVFAEIEKKKSELARLEDNISGMEALRQRKDREFQRLQRCVWLWFVACGLWFVVVVVVCGLWFVVVPVVVVCAGGLWLVACGLWLVACGLWLVVLERCRAHAFPSHTSFPLTPTATSRSCWRSKRRSWTRCARRACSWRRRRPRLLRPRRPRLRRPRRPRSGRRPCSRARRRC